jgi:hypothetical protein
MKKGFCPALPSVLVLSLVLCALAPAQAEDAPASATMSRTAASRWSFHSELDLFLGLRAGAEYAFSDSFGLRSTLGACLISPLKDSYSLVGISHFRPREAPYQLDLEYGLIYADFNALEMVFNLDPDINWPIFYWMPGASASVGYRLKGGSALSLRVGAGPLLGIEDGKWVRVSFMPMIGLQYDYKP